MNPFMSDIAMSNKFPGKLWRMVNTCASGAIGWSQGGHTVIIQQAKFQHEYLDPPNCVFKTSNIGSFIRQLNLYGFRKLNALRFADSLDSEDVETRGVHEFQNDYFIQGRPDLLSRLRRNVGIRRSREMAVKRRMDIFHAIPKAVSDSRYLQYVETRETNGHTYRSVCQQHKNTSLKLEALKSAQSGTTASATTLSATNGQQSEFEIPVFLQWDGQSYKYVILPDHSVHHQQQQQNANIRQQQNTNMPTLQKHSINLPTLQRIVQQPSQPASQQVQPPPQSHVLLPRHDVISKELDRNRSGSKMTVVHIPDEDGNDTRQYCLVNVRSTGEEDGEEIFEGQTKHSEYIDMYDMARSFTSSSRSSQSGDDSSKVSDSLLADIQVLDEDSGDTKVRDSMLFDSSPTILNRDASLPSICPSSSLDMESPCISQSTPPGETGMFAYDVIDKSELDVYIHGHDDLFLSTTDRDELVLFPGVNMTAAGDGIIEGSYLEYQDKDLGDLDNEPLVVENIENPYKRHNFGV